MRLDREREVNFILSKSPKKVDKSLAEKAYDILPSWREIDDKRNYIYSIVNTMTELNEVNSVKILIDGQESNGFEDIGLSFSGEFQKLK